MIDWRIVRDSERRKGGINSAIECVVVIQSRMCECASVRGCVGMREERERERERWFDGWHEDVEQKQIFTESTKILLTMKLIVRD